MKRLYHILAIGVSFLLIIATSGIIISRHYCGDQLIDVRDSQVENSCCTENSCCHTEFTFIQLEEDFIPSEFKKKAESTKFFYLHQITWTISHPIIQKKPHQLQGLFLPAALSPPFQAWLQVFRL